MTTLGFRHHRAAVGPRHGWRLTLTAAGLLQFVLVLGACLPATGAPGGKEPATAKEPGGPDDTGINPMHIDLDAVVHKSSRKAGDGDYDNKRQRIAARVSVRNRSPDDLKELRTELYIIGQSVNDSNSFALLRKLDQEISVPRGRQASTDETEMSLTFDDNDSAQFGFKYYGYIVRLVDVRGRLIKLKVNKPSLRRLADKMSEFKDDDCFDASGNRLGVRMRFGNDGIIR